MPHICILQEVLNGSRIRLELIAEKRAKGPSKIFQTARTRFQEINCREQTLVVYSCRRQSSLLPLCFDQRQQTLSGVGADVFSVEPGQLGAVEAGIGTRGGI